MDIGGFFVKHHMDISDRSSFFDSFSRRRGYPILELKWIEDDFYPRIPVDFKGWLIEDYGRDHKSELESEEDCFFFSLYDSAEQEIVDTLTFGPSYLQADAVEWQAVLWAIEEYWEEGRLPQNFIEARNEWLGYAKEYSAKECLLFNIERHASLCDALLDGKDFETALSEYDKSLHLFKLSDLFAHPMPEKDLADIWYDVVLIDDLIPIKSNRYDLQFKKITLERTMCSGRCPVYSITVKSSSKVSYIGDAFVKIKGHHTWRLDEASLKMLDQIIKECHYFQLQRRDASRWSPNTPSCITSVEMQDGRQRTIKHDLQEDDEWPAALLHFEEGFEALVGLKDYVG